MSSRPQPIQCAHCRVAATTVLCGPLELDVCDLCGSVWFDRDELAAARDASDAEPGEDFRAALRALRPSQKPTEPRAYVDCPVCATSLTRRAHPHVAGVIAYACREHGAWVTRHDLLHLLTEIERYGAETLTRRKIRVAQLEAEQRDRTDHQWEEHDRKMFRRAALWNTHLWF